MITSKQVKVYAKDRTTQLATVGRQTSSIGAAKAAKVPGCQYARVNGHYAWIAA